jgi:hypothetical protein
VLGPDPGASLQVCHRAGHLENSSVVVARAEAKAVRRGAEQVLPRIIELDTPRSRPVPFPVSRFYGGRLRSIRSRAETAEVCQTGPQIRRSTALNVTFRHSEAR